MGTIVGMESVTRVYKIKTGNGYVIERPLQLVCDLEIRQNRDSPKYLNLSLASLLMLNMFET